LPSTPSSSAEPRSFWRQPRALVVIGVCVLVPLVLLAVALTSNRHDKKDPETSISTAPGLVPDHVVATGDVVPTFRLRTLTGSPVNTARYRGRPYVVSFWASWCGPCRKEMPLLNEAYGKRAGDLPMVGVTFQDPESESKQFVSKYGIDFPIAPDDGYRIAKAFGVINVPTTFFVGADGKVVERVAGEGKVKDLEAALQRLTATS
jgi:cytochrome c biogenesis protein CcmG/thiol:disulfide interchange protein DsbE